MIIEQITQPIRSKTERIPNTLLYPPHKYGSDEFSKKRGGVTIFLSGGVELTENHIGLEVVEGAQYVFSDRLDIHYSGNASVEFSRLLERQLLDRPTALVIEEHLRRVADNPELLLQHIKTGVSGSGYPYQQFGFF